MRCPILALAAIGALALLLLGCKPAGKVGEDGYRWEGAETRNLELHIQLKLHKSLDDLRRAGLKAGAFVMWDSELIGWSKIDKRGWCEVHILDPDYVYTVVGPGHELFHCAFGQFHPSQP